MIYMVEMAFPHPARLAEWHHWYLAHIRVLLTVPGFRASQRFEAIVDNPSPYLALHEVSGPEMFESPAYRGRGGPTSVGEWHDLQTNWHRNLLDGLKNTPDVPADAHLLMLRDADNATLPNGVEPTWMRAIALDRSVERCSLTVIYDPTPFLDLARRDNRVRLFHPISEKIHAAA
jgi:hypothetical protein